MQSDVVPGDPCLEGAELKGGADVPVDETLVREEGLESERESKGMEVDKVGEGLWKAVSERSSDMIETSSLEGVNDACVGKEGKDLGMNVVAVEGVIDEDNPFKASFNSFAQQLFPNPVNVDRSGKDMEAKKIVEKCSIEAKRLSATSDKEDCGGFDVDRSGKEVEAKTTVESHSVEVKRLAVTNDKEESGVDIEEIGVSEHSRVSPVDLDECIRNYKKKGKKKGGFCVSDLVWGKVKSHPWWPAQIFDSSDASDNARKYSKLKGYFVCYFGDQTFAWNDEAKLKPFAANFSHMVKQTKMEAFRHAVDCVLNETSRRVESELSCLCNEDAYNRLKTQVVENAGIREESRIQVVGDRFFTASSFEPVKFLDYVKHLAQQPHASVDRLEHVVARAQMTSFYRWKGIYHLAEFGYLIGYVNDEADAPVTAKKEKGKVIADEAAQPESIAEVDITRQKRKKMTSDNGQSSRKVRCLSDLVGKKGMRKKDEKETNVKASSKSISFSARRRKEVKSLHLDSKTKECSPLGTTKQFKDTKPSFRVGESILRVAGQLSQPSPLLKFDVSSPGHAVNDEEA